MIEVWNIFDAAYLSRSKAELLPKLYRAINFSVDRTPIYNAFENNYMNKQSYT
jgi:hypothetical protein